MKSKHQIINWDEELITFQLDKNIEDGVVEIPDSLWSGIAEIERLLNIKITITHNVELAKYSFGHISKNELICEYRPKFTDYDE